MSSAGFLEYNFTHCATIECQHKIIFHVMKKYQVGIGQNLGIIYKMRV
jgi:hypothetical protein